MIKVRIFLKFVLLSATAAILISAVSASAGDIPRGADMLLRTYNSNSARLQKNNFGLPLFLDSFERDDRVTVDAYGVFEYPFSTIANELKIPANWCDIVSLTPNIKACTHRELQGAWLLTFYLGRKVYQTPEEAQYQAVYRYRKIEQQQGYLDILLTADAGPYGTKDHTMKFEAAPLDGKRTFVRVSYSYSDSVALRLASKLYFATLGWGKTGFTVTGTDTKGQPVYIGGPRGAIERNAVRYYFAIQSFMNSLRYPENSRFSKRTSEWYDLTTRYSQLRDLDQKDYLSFKAKEHNNQVTLQRRVETSAP